LTKNSQHNHDPVYDGSTSLNILETFPAFVANGWGLYSDRAPLTVKSINQTIPALERLASYNERGLLNIKPIDAFLNGIQLSDGSERLRRLFSAYGSDKGATHNYHLAYDRIIGNPEHISKIFEIGLGTNNVDIVSTMGSGGSPGASLRAFRDYCPSAQIFGADFDKRILFVEDRIETFFVDQTEIETFMPLSQAVGADFDLMIDDGLHAPNANLNSLDFFLPRIKVGGWAVIEDIALPSVAIWKLVGSILPNRFDCHLLQAAHSLLFIVNRLE
jgi:hypothetical protein